MPRRNLGDEHLADLAAFLESPALLKKGENDMFPGGPMMGGWWIIPIIIFIGLVCMGLFMVFMRGGFGPPWQDSSRHQRRSRESETALDILRKRYAKGEITQEEFDQMRMDLE